MPYQPPARPDNYLVWAILATIFCCLPFGVVSIAYAAQVNGRWDAGDYTGAKKNADSALLWALVSLGAALVGCVLIFLLVIAGPLTFFVSIP